MGDSDEWLDGIAASKIADFAGEADAADADVLSRYQGVKRIALLACLVHTAGSRARDDLARMLCKRMAVTIKKGKAKLEEIQSRQRAVTERLIGTYKGVLEGLSPTGAVGTAQEAAARMVLVAVAALSTTTDGQCAREAEDQDTGEGCAVSGERRADHEAAAEALLTAVRLQAAGMGTVRGLVEDAGGFAAQLADIEEVSAYHGENYELLVQRFFKTDRSTMLGLVGALQFEATSQDHSVLEALKHAVAYWGKTRDFIPDHVDGVVLDLSFASVNWMRAVRDRQHPGMLAKRHFEAMVFAYLAAELRTGDIAVKGAAEYGDWSQHLLSFEQCEPLLEEFCAEVGLPSTAEGFCAALRERHDKAAGDLALVTTTTRTCPSIRTACPR